MPLPGTLWESAHHALEKQDPMKAVFSLKCVKHSMADISPGSENNPYLHAIGGPAASMGGAGDVGLELRGEGGQVQVEVPGGPQHRRGPGELALGVDELLRCQQLPTVVALVSLGVLQAHSLSRRAICICRSSQCSCRKPIDLVLAGVPSWSHNQAPKAFHRAAESLGTADRCFVRLCTS